MLLLLLLPLLLSLNFLVIFFRSARVEGDTHGGLRLLCGLGQSTSPLWASTLENPLGHYKLCSNCTWNPDGFGVPSSAPQVTIGQTGSPSADRVRQGSLVWALIEVGGPGTQREETWLLSWYLCSYPSSVTSGKSCSLPGLKSPI